MRDFTLQIYKRLLEILLAKGYQFVRFDEYTIDNSKLKIQNSKIVILRHDVDRLRENSLATAKIENELGIKGTYYFRIVPESLDEKIIKEIALPGHEIGYHYEEIDTAYRQLKMNNGKLKIRKNNAAMQPFSNDASSPLSMTIDLAYELFKVNLDKLRSIAPITTICMHGSPGSKYDNKIIWRKYSYKDLGIIGEPYFDINFNEFAYFTDTGRRWNGSKYNIRDKVNSKFNFDFKTTQDIIDNIDKLPYKLMFTIHPERWNDKPFPWIKEFVLQNISNFAKRGLLLLRKY